MIQQLRIYDIDPTLKNEFGERFRDHASRIMASYGFHIVSMWFSDYEGRVEFVYVLQWNDVDTMKNKWADFMADEEWATIKTQTREKYGEMVLGKVRDQVLDGTEWFENKI